MYMYFVVPIANFPLSILFSFKKERDGHNIGLRILISFFIIAV